MSTLPNGKDLYMILRVSQTASAKEIKLAYYQIAQQLHPDKHNGCLVKLESFKLVNEAYNTLSDESKRREYDFKRGFRYNANRRTAPPVDYRKVYTSRPPPHWKTTWDEEKHQEMHYGDGILKEAIRQATKTAKEQGAFEYHSPLGKGFSFSQTENDDGLNGVQYNPYSKHTPQGPPKVVFEYEEVSNLSGRTQILRRERIVQDMHQRRSERHEMREATATATDRFSYAAPAWPYAKYSTQAAGGRPKHENDCVIL